MAASLEQLKNWERGIVRYVSRIVEKIFYMPT